MTQNMDSMDASMIPMNARGTPDAAALIESPDEEFGVSMHECIPISKKDIHRFIQEICQENLFLIGVNNEIDESYEKMKTANNAEEVRLRQQIDSTESTLSVLSDRLNFLYKKIAMKEQPQTVAKPTVKSKRGRNKEPKKNEIDLREDIDLYGRLVEEIYCINDMLAKALGIMGTEPLDLGKSLTDT